VPLGPIGGADGIHLLKCLHRCTPNGSCEESDPTVVPPHSNFHPLPTRPVFSPPQALPGIYAPWPSESGIPTNGSPLQPTPAVEVQSQPKRPGNANSPETITASTDDTWHAPLAEPPQWHAPLRR
jgi:hypothetical protein